MLHNKEQGFSIIELMTVMVIISLLAAITISTFINVRYRSYDAEAKSNIRNAVDAAQTYYTGNNGMYTDMDAVALADIFHGITFKNGSVSTDNDVYISNVTATTFIVTCRSQSGETFIASANGRITSLSF